MKENKEEGKGSWYWQPNQKLFAVSNKWSDISWSQSIPGKRASHFPNVSEWPKAMTDTSYSQKYSSTGKKGWCISYAGETKKKKKVKCIPYYEIGNEAWSSVWGRGTTLFLLLYFGHSSSQSSLPIAKCIHIPCHRHILSDLCHRASYPSWRFTPGLKS